MKVSDYVFDFLKKRGVKHCFMLPGGGAMHLVDSLGSSGIDYIPFLHEQGASIAAEAYGQHTNTPGVCLVTSGPGATNAITAVTAGWIDSTPMFIISGQAKRSDLVGNSGVRQIGSQEVPTIPMVQPVTKYAVEIMEPNEIRYHLEKAWYEATTGRTGPVWISIPLDVQGTQIDENTLEGYESPEKESADITKEINATVELIKTAKKPLILAGNGIKLSGAYDAFIKLIRLLRMPVQTTWKTIDMLVDEDPLYVGHPGIMGDRGANRILQEADLLLSIGSRLDTSITAFNDEHFACHAKKVIIDIDEHELARMQIPDSEKVCCDAGDFIVNLFDVMQGELDMAPCDEWADWLKKCKEIRGKNPVVVPSHSESKENVLAYHFIDVLCNNLRENDIIVPESSGGAGEITYQAFRIKSGQKMKNAAGLGSMGFGLPYAIGSCIANDRKRTILINGDGAFQLNIQEMETAHRLGLPIKMFVWYNEGYASIRSMQRKNFDGRYVGSESGSGLTIPDMVRVAEAYGFQTIEIRTNDDVKKKVAEAMKDDQPLFCLVHVDPTETVSPRVQAIVGKDGKISSGVLEKMWPPAE